MSVYMTVSLTVERYMSVCQPLLRHRQSWLSTPALVLPAIILSFAITSPNYILFTYHSHSTHSNINKNNTLILEETNETFSTQFVVDDYLEEVEIQILQISLSSSLLHLQLFVFDEGISVDKDEDYVLAEDIDGIDLEASGYLIWQRKHIVCHHCSLKGRKL